MHYFMRAGIYSMNNNVPWMRPNACLRDILTRLPSATNWQFNYDAGTAPAPAPVISGSSAGKSTQPAR